MKHTRLLSVGRRAATAPVHAQDIPASYKVDFVVAMLGALKPVLQFKEGPTTITT